MSYIPGIPELSITFTEDGEIVETLTKGDWIRVADDRDSTKAVLVRISHIRTKTGDILLDLANGWTVRANEVLEKVHK